MALASSSSATIHYTVEGGGGDTLLLLMGLGGHASEWGEPFVSDLARDHRVIRMDNRGIAQSQSKVAAWSLEDMAADARTVLDALGLGRVHVVGTSMGGMIAQCFALEYPERVSRLVLISTAFGGAEMLPPEAKAAATLVAQPGMSISEQRRRGLQALVGEGFAETHAELIEMLVEQRERNPTRGAVFRAQLDALLSSDRSQRVSSIQAPTLVIHGDQDPLVPVENGRMLQARIPGSQFVLLEGCGHMPHLEQPGAAAKAIREFLAR